MLPKESSHSKYRLFIIVDKSDEPFVDNRATCVCPQTYKGEFCEIEKSFCEQFPNYCQNGDCNDGGFCECFPGFTGTACEINIDDCVGNGCVNGRCVDLVEGYECRCDPGFS